MAQVHLALARADLVQALREPAAQARAFLRRELAVFLELALTLQLVNLLVRELIHLVPQLLQEAVNPQPTPLELVLPLPLVLAAWAADNQLLQLVLEQVHHVKLLLLPRLRLRL